MDNLTKFIRTVKSMNIRKSVIDCQFVLFPTSCSSAIMLHQLNVAKAAFEELDIEWDVAYFQNADCSAKGLFLL